MSAGLIYSTLYFSHRTVGELVVIYPTEPGLNTPEFMTLFNSFALYEESESERTRRHRAHTYNQVLSLFHNDTDGSYREKMGWSKGTNKKQVITDKIPPTASDAINNKLSPQRRPVKPSLYFQGKENSDAAGFLKTINSKHTCKVEAEASMFKGEFWDPRRSSEDALEQARVRLQRTSNVMICSQAISDIADTAFSASLPKSEAEYKDVLLKIKAISDENIRLMEPALVFGINSYTWKKREVRAQIIKGLKPARLYEPLMHAPIFSEDCNIFPNSVIKSTNDLALSIEEKVVLPKDPANRKSRAARGTKRLSYNKNPFPKKFKPSEDNHSNNHQNNHPNNHHLNEQNKPLGVQNKSFRKDSRVGPANKPKGAPGKRDRDNSNHQQKKGYQGRGKPPQNPRNRRD